MPALRVSVLLSAVALLCARHGECVERGAPPYLATAIPRTSAPGSRQPLQQQKNPPRRRRSEGPMQASKKRIEIAATERIVHADGSVTLPPAAEENIPEHEKPRLYYHEGWKTCTIEGTNVESMSALPHPAACENNPVQVRPAPCCLVWTNRSPCVWSTSCKMGATSPSARLQRISAVFKCLPATA